MTRTLIMFALTLGLFATPASADRLKGCYSARYSPAHMQAHPGQTPRFLSVRITPGATTVFKVTARLRGKTGKWTESGICDKVGSKLDCSVECDGGGFTLQQSGTRAILRNTRGFRVAREACNGEVISHMIEAVRGNRKFTLRKRGASACR
jgi:hypothetical protein